MAKRNPSLLGQDLVKLGKQAVGLVGAGALNDKFLWPAVKGFVPGGGILSQAAHGVGTLASALLIGKGADVLGQRALGNDLQAGGRLLGGGELIGSVVPGFTVSGSFPTSFPFQRPVVSVEAPGGPLLLTPATPAIAASQTGRDRVYSI